MRRAVGKRDLVGAFKGGVYLRREPIGLGESRLVGHPTLGHTGEQVLLLGLLATHESRLRRPRLAFPKHGLGIEVREPVADLIPTHHLERTAVGHKIGLLQKPCLRLEHAGLELGAERPRGGFHVLYHEEGRVGPFLHELMVP